MADDEADKLVKVQLTLIPKEELLRNVSAGSVHQSTETHMSCAKVSETATNETVLTHVTSALDETGPLTGNCVLSSCDYSFSSMAKKEPHEGVGESNMGVTLYQGMSSSCPSEQKSDILLQSTGGAASTTKEHSNVLLKSSGNSCSIAQLDASHSILLSLCDGLEPKRERTASNESGDCSKSCSSHVPCDNSGYSGHKSGGNINSNAYSDMSVRKCLLRSHEMDYTDMTKNLGEESSKQMVVGAVRGSTKLTADELSSTSGATAILRPTCVLVNSEHNVDNLCAINNNDSPSLVLSNSQCGSISSTSTQKRALVNRNQYPLSSSCGVSSLHLNHKCLHITEDHHICREESRHLNPTNTAQSFRNNPPCVLTMGNHLGLGSCLHSQDLPPSQLSCLSDGGSHFQRNNPVSEDTNASNLHDNRNLSARCDCSSCCVPTPVNACHCAGHRYTNQMNPSNSSDFNCSSRANSGCSHGHYNCGNGSMLLRDSSNSSCEVEGHGTVSAVRGGSSTSTSMATINRCSDGRQMSLGSLRQFLPINAADIAVSWASNGTGGLSSFVYTTSGSRENSAHHCCSGRTEMCIDSHRQHPTSGCTASSHLGSTSWTNHSGGCHAYQNNSHCTATQVTNNNHSSGIHASHHCDSSSKNAAIYGRRPHASSTIYGTTAGHECSTAQDFDGAGTFQQHRLAVPQGSHNNTNSLIRPTQHQPAHYQNLSGSATSLHSSGSHGSGCGHWCTSCRVKLAQGSGSTVCNTGVGGGCSSKAVKHLASWNGLVVQSSDTDMRSFDTKSSNSLDVKASPEPRRSLKNKMIQKLAKHRQRIPSDCKETSGSITKKKKPAFPFWMTCLSLMTKTPLNGPNVSSLASQATPDGTSLASEPSQLILEAPSVPHNDPEQGNQSGSSGAASYSHAEGQSSDTLERGPVTHCDAHPDDTLSQIPLTTLLGILPRNASSDRALYPSDDEPRYTPDPVRAAAASNNAKQRVIDTMPLNINSMLGLQILLERSLMLDLTGPSALPQERISQHLERLNSSMDEEAIARWNNTQQTVHTQVDYIHFLVPDLLSITNCSFYWGKMDRYEAERLLDKRPEGTFLLRDSAQLEYLFSVSFRRYGKSLHARIEQGSHKFSFDSHDPGVFASDTVCGLVEHYKDPSCCMFFEPMLTNPLCRSFPFPLQHLCRATICSNSTYDGINNLELPKTLRHYLKEYHYKQLVRVRRLDH